MMKELTIWMCVCLVDWPLRLWGVQEPLEHVAGDLSAELDHLACMRLLSVLQVCQDLLKHSHHRQLQCGGKFETRL